MTKDCLLLMCCQRFEITMQSALHLLLGRLDMNFKLLLVHTDLLLTCDQSLSQ